MSVIDYSPTLVELANRIMPDADITIGDVVGFRQDKQYGEVLSHGVFFYFESLLYAEYVLKIRPIRLMRTLN